MNAYLYATANSLTYVDPYGLFELPVLSQGFVDATAGFGDAISSGFGLFDTSLSELAREAIGVNNSVNQCSATYTGGRYAGYGFGVGFGGTAIARTLGWTINFNRYKNAGGAGINVLKDGQRKFGADWHKFKHKGSMVNRPHYHRGSTKSQLKKHRHWQGGF